MLTANPVDNILAVGGGLMVMRSWKPGLVFDNCREPGLTQKT